MEPQSEDNVHSLNSSIEKHNVLDGTTNKFMAQSIAYREK